MRREAGHARALIILFLGLLGGLAVLLNPNAQHHQQAIHDAVADRYPVAGAAGLDVIAAHLPDYHSWRFGSYTNSLNDFHGCLWQSFVSSITPYIINGYCPRLSTAVC